MADVQAADASRKVDELVSIHIFDDCTLGAVRDHGREMENAPWDRGMAPLKHGLRPGTGNRAVDSYRGHRKDLLLWLGTKCSDFKRDSWWFQAISVFLHIFCKISTCPLPHIITAMAPSRVY